MVVGPSSYSTVKSSSYRKDSKTAQIDDFPFAVERPAEAHRSEICFKRNSGNFRSGVLMAAGLMARE